jgi:hypothetical protein
MANNEQVQDTPAAPKRNWARDLRSRMGVLGELFAFLWKVKLWWLIPMVVVLLVFIIVFVFLPSTPLAPFIYSLH